MTQSETASLLDEVFEQQALAIGGVVATYGVEDDVVWRLMENLGAIRTRTLKRLTGAENVGDGGHAPTPVPHPAIRDYLDSLQREEVR